MHHLEVGVIFPTGETVEDVHEFEVYAGERFTLTFNKRCRCWCDNRNALIVESTGLNAEITLSEAGEYKVFVHSRGIVPYKATIRIRALPNKSCIVASLNVRFSAQHEWVNG